MAVLRVTVLEGKVAVVLGAGSPIGIACAVDLARAGARVMLDDSEAISAMVMAGLSREYLSESVALADGLGSAAISDIFSAARDRFGTAQVFVDCAEVFLRGSIRDSSQAEWNSVFETNVYRFILCVQGFSAELLGARLPGSIVVLSSSCGNRGAAEFAMYAASKAAVDSVMRTLCIELGGHGIRVNAVAPSVESQQGCQEVPLAREANPAEIAAVVTFLCSDNASYVTGQVIGVDGGASARGRH